MKIFGTFCGLSTISRRYLGVVNAGIRYNGLTLFNSLSSIRVKIILVLHIFGLQLYSFHEWCPDCWGAKVTSGTLVGIHGLKSVAKWVVFGKIVKKWVIL